MASYEQSIEILNQTHQFPSAVLVKVIGLNHETFVANVMTVLCAELAIESPPPHSIRQTPGGRHVAISVEPRMENAEQVLAVYERLRSVEGVVMLM